jgi:SAM-dependent methyltransferase
MDLWGRIYLDHWHGDPHPHRFIRDDDKSDTIPDAAGYFVSPRDVGEIAVLGRLTGRVLDLGAGAGSYARFLEDRGVVVTAIDSSPGAVAVCRERGCRDARIADMDALPPDLVPFDSIICMGNTLGIGQGPGKLPRRLRALRSLIRPGGRLLAAIRDPLSTTDPEHLAYHARNRALGRPPGLVRTRLSYRGAMGPWWDLWMPTEAELDQAARAAGWVARCLDSKRSNRLYELTAPPGEASRCS